MTIDELISGLGIQLTSAFPAGESKREVTVYDALTVLQTVTTFLKTFMAKHEAKQSAKAAQPPVAPPAGVKKPETGSTTPTQTEAK